MKKNLLFPRATTTRRTESLDGYWSFKFDPKSAGKTEGWQNGLTDAMQMPVPASFNDFFTEKADRDYIGDFWYEKEFYVPCEWKDYELNLRFAGATHRAIVYVNGVECGSHEGGFQPFNIQINDVVKYDGPNKVVVLMNNELSRETLPVGMTTTLPNGVKVCKPYFDFFNYAGLQRSVILTAIPHEQIVDFDLVHHINGTDATVDYKVYTTGDHDVAIHVYDKDGNCVATADGKEGTLEIKNVHLWQVRNSYLYNFVITIVDNGKIIDEYKDKIGIRTVEVKGNRILINGSNVYLKGFGKHEDSDINGRGTSLNVVKRDFELMKWVGANSFRTSHYPYTEEIYQMADEYGFLVIDECAAVGLMESMMNALSAANAENRTTFFQNPEVFTGLAPRHKTAISELIQRDKNHACVFAWSLLNEPDTLDDKAPEYFKPLFELAHAEDPQQRPRTFASLMSSLPGKCKCTQFCDFVMLNRYYGWYLMGGDEIGMAEAAFRKEMDAWEKDGRPVMFSEYGADTMAGIHKLPTVMFSEEYQWEYLQMQHRVFDSYSCVTGEQMWNFADFQTTEGIIRVDGNKKGLFTRNRQPKYAAYKLKERWDSLPLNYKG